MTPKELKQIAVTAAEGGYFREEFERLEEAEYECEMKSLSSCTCLGAYQKMRRAVKKKLKDLGCTSPLTDTLLNAIEEATYPDVEY